MMSINQWLSHGGQGNGGEDPPYSSVQGEKRGSLEPARLGERSKSHGWRLRAERTSGFLQAAGREQDLANGLLDDYPSPGDLVRGNRMWILHLVSQICYDNGVHGGLRYGYQKKRS